MSFSKSFPGLQVRADLGGGSCQRVDSHTSSFSSSTSFSLLFYLFILFTVLSMDLFSIAISSPFFSLFISRSSSSITNSSYKSFYILCFHIYGCMLTTGNSINSRTKTVQYDCLIKKIALIRLHISSNIM